MSIEVVTKNASFVLYGYYISYAKNKINDV